MHCYGNLQVLGVLILGLVVCCSSCFVRNCPPGGKRSLDSLTNFHAERQCMRCGPRGRGQCIGPNICCGPTIGCYFNTIETAACEKENEIRTPCDTQGPPCGPSGESRCAAIGVCCNDQKCIMDRSCGDDVEADGGDPDLMGMIRQWFDKRGFGSRK